MNATIAPDGLDWDDLFRQYHQRIYRYMRRGIFGPHESDETAQDLTASVFARAVEAVDRGHQPHTSAAAWLFTIARNLLCDYYRARRHVPDFMRLDAMVFDTFIDEIHGHTKGEMIASQDDTPQEYVERSMTCWQVQRAIGKLSYEQGLVVKRRMQGYNYAEIAAELGKSEGAAKQLQRRAWDNLRTMLQGVA